MNFKSETENKILNYFFINSKARHYINELARILVLDPKNTHRKLVELEKRGILKSEFLGRQRYFFLDSDNQLTKKYRSIFFQTVGLEARLKKIAAMNKKIKSAYIFGSYAIDKMDASSDLDLLVIGSHSSIELHKAFNKIQQEIGREINVIDFNESEFRLRKKRGDGFLKNIFSQKTIKIK
ncbi:MAG: nucleotidyltransferase domain-containing protein [Patescibacteria group bacterium]